MEKIGVGIIGASPLNPGWAVAAHIPALAALPQYEIRAVSTSRRESAEVASKAFGVTAYDNAQDLIYDPGVDLVVVAVRVTGHYALVSDVLRARKMVFAEWPLGMNLAEALDLNTKAHEAGVRTVVGLQARFSPQVQHARQLIAEGYIGDVLSTSLVGSAGSWSGITRRNSSYIFDESNGATPLSVSMLHALDALTLILGDCDELVAASGVRTPQVRIAEDGSLITATTPDQVALCGKLKSGAIASVFYRGGQSRGANFYWEINGSNGDLVLEADLGNLQVADLRLKGGRGTATHVADLIVPDPDRQLLSTLAKGMASNVARLYLQFARDLKTGTHIAPDFDYAVARHELVDRIRRAAQDLGN